MKTTFAVSNPVSMVTAVVMSTLPFWSGCVPDVDTDESLVLAPRLIAVTAEPAEAPPGEAVTWRAWIASPDGTLETSSAPAWSQCLVRPSLAESGSVSQRCVNGEEGTFTALGQGTVVQGILPADACARFGPDPPPVEPGQPAGRPASPDVTGGYRQPMVLNGDASWSYDQLIFEQRVRCNLAGATPEESVRFRQQYRNNANPRLTSLRVLDAQGNTLGEVTSSDLEPVTVSQDSRITLVAEWPLCPDGPVCGDGYCTPDESIESCAAECTTPQGCNGSETWLWYDPVNREFSNRRESLRFAWLASQPGLNQERNGVDAESALQETSIANTFDVPSTPGAEIFLWVVVRDERGGSFVQPLTLQVQ